MIKENTSFNEQTSLDILKNRNLPIEEREENFQPSEFEVEDYIQLLIGHNLDLQYSE